MYLREFDNLVKTVYNEINADKKDFVYMLPVDVKESDECYKVLVSLPGVKKESVNATLKNGLLTIDVNNVKEDESDEAEKYLKREITFYSKLKRVLDFKDNVGSDVNAKFENGVLTLILPKVKKEDKEYQIKID